MVKKFTVLIVIVTIMISIGIAIAADPPAGNTFSWACYGGGGGGNDNCPGCEVNGGVGTPACEAYCDGFEISHACGVICVKAECIWGS